MAIFYFRYVLISFLYRKNSIDIKIIFHKILKINFVSLFL